MCNKIFIIWGFIALSVASTQPLAHFCMVAAGYCARLHSCGAHKKLGFGLYALSTSIAAKNKPRNSFYTSKAKKKPHMTVRLLLLSSGSRTRTCGLRVMSPTSYHCSIPRYFVARRGVEPLLPG